MVPSVDGIVPMRLFPLKSIAVSADKPEIVAGIVPCRPALATLTLLLTHTRHRNHATPVTAPVGTAAR